MRDRLPGRLGSTAGPRSAISSAERSALKNTGMAVLRDIGEARDVHPHNKMDVGKRLALWALKS